MKEKDPTPDTTPVSSSPAAPESVPEPYKPSATQTSAPIRPTDPVKTGGLPRSVQIVLAIVVICVIAALGLYQFNRVSKRDYKAAATTASTAYEALNYLSDNSYGPNLIEGADATMMAKYTSAVGRGLTQYKTADAKLAKMKALRGDQAKAEYDVFKQKSTGYESMMEEYRSDSQAILASKADCGGLAAASGRLNGQIQPDVPNQLDTLAKRITACVTALNKISGLKTESLQKELKLYKTLGPELATRDTALAQALRGTNAAAKETAMQNLTDTTTKIFGQTAQNNNEFALKLQLAQPNNELAGLRRYLERQSR